MIIDNNVINMEYNMKEYFPHDGGARRDPKVLALCMKYGIEGYGIYFMILEMIFEGKLYRITDHNIKAMAYDIRIDEKKLVVIMEYLSSEECGLMEKRDGFYFSKRMNDTLDNIRKLSKINRANANKRHNQNKLDSGKSNNDRNATAMRPQKERSANGVPEEKRREDYIKEENSNIVAKKTKQEKLAERELVFRKSVIAYNLDKGNKYPEKMIDKFLNYYTEPNRSITKMKCETYPTWEIGRRLGTWYRNSKEFNKQSVKESNREVFEQFAKE